MVCVLLLRTKIKNEASSWHLGQKWQITKRSPGWTDAIHYNRVHILSRFCFVCLYTMPIGYLYFWVTRKSACKRCFLCQIIYRKEFMLSLMMSIEPFEFVGEYSFHFSLEGLIQFKACLHCFWDFECTFEGRTRYLSNLTLTSKGRKLFLPWFIWSAIKECRILAHLFQSSAFLKAAG